MADFSKVAYSTPDGDDYVAQDYAVHLQTYESFIRLLKYSTAVVALTLILMAIFLT